MLIFNLAVGPFIRRSARGPAGLEPPRFDSRASLGKRKMKRPPNQRQFKNPRHVASVIPVSGEARREEKGRADREGKRKRDRWRRGRAKEEELGGTCRNREEHHAQSCMQIEEEGRERGVGARRQRDETEKRSVSRRKVGDHGRMRGGGGGFAAGTLRKICSPKISICKCDTAGAPRLSAGSTRLAPSRICIPRSAFRTLIFSLSLALPGAGDAKRRKRVRCLPFY